MLFTLLPGRRHDTDTWDMAGLFEDNRDLLASTQRRQILSSLKHDTLDFIENNTLRGASQETVHVFTLLLVLFINLHKTMFYFFFSIGNCLKNTL